jgi:hypothetical protein
LARLADTQRRGEFKRKVLRFFEDCAPKKWPLWGSFSEALQ